MCTTAYTSAFACTSLCVGLGRALQYLVHLTSTNTAVTTAQVLGTFITEFAAGRRCCESLFSSAAAARAVADQLVALAVHYDLQGWLINIENGLSTEQASCEHRELVVMWVTSLPQPLATRSSSCTS